MPCMNISQLSLSLSFSLHVCVCFRSLSAPNRIFKQVIMKPPPPPPPPPPQVDTKTTTTPVVKKWNALDADRIYGGNKEERTYSQAFVAKKLLSMSNKPPYKACMQAKREREKGNAFQAPLAGPTSEEPEAVALPFSISLEGHGLDRGEASINTNRDIQQQQKKKAKKADVHQTYCKNRTTISTSMFGNQEGGSRPTIERGGTNTISMEVSGVGSLSSAGAEAQTTLLSQNTKESFIHKKQSYRSEDDHAEPEKKVQSPTHSSSKKPPIQHEASDTSVSSSGTTSAPVEGTHRRNRKKKNSDGSRSSNNKPHSEFGSTLSPTRDTPRTKTTLTVTDMDSSVISGGGGISPQELDSALLETQVHSNPEQALRTAQQSIASDDWNNKCEGLVMVMCIARHYPNLLLPQLHTTLRAVQKEVCIHARVS